MKLWRIETGKVPAKVADARVLCRLNGVDAATTDALAALTEGTTGQDWWERGDESVRLAGLDLYLGLESAASRLSPYQPEIVPGLFQTEEYARAVQWGPLPDPTEADVNRTPRTPRARPARQEPPARTHEPTADRRRAQRRGRPLLDKALGELQYVEQRCRTIEELAAGRSLPRSRPGEAGSR